MNTPSPPLRRPVEYGVISLADHLMDPVSGHKTSQRERLHQISRQAILADVETTQDAAGRGPRAGDAHLRDVAADIHHVGDDALGDEGRVLAWLAGEQWKLDAFTWFAVPRKPSAGSNWRKFGEYW